MRTTGLTFSTFLIAAGAIMAWGLSVDAEGLNVNTIGLILFAVGIAGFVGTFALASTPSRTLVESEARQVSVDATQ